MARASLVVIRTPDRATVGAGSAGSIKPKRTAPKRTAPNSSGDALPDGKQSAPRPRNGRMGSVADDALLVPAERACALLSVGDWSLRRLVADGKIRVVYIGSRKLFPVDSLRAFATGAATGACAGDPQLAS